MTASDDFLRCFARPGLELGDDTELRPIVRRFRDSFGRGSEAARIGWSAWQVLAGSPSPIERELSALRPRFALVQFGTNDLELGRIRHFVSRLLDLTDLLIERGVIPILFTIPARKDRSDRDVWVPRYNAFIRAIAQGRRVPLVDFHRELARLPGQGLAKDGIHPSTYKGPRGRDACALDAEGLRHGYNLRNLLALRALYRVTRALEGQALEPAQPRPDPMWISELPFVDARRALPEPLSTRACPSRGLAPAGLVYRFTLSRSTALRVSLFTAGDTSLALTRAAPAHDCIASGREGISAQLGRGSYDLSIGVASASAPELFLTALSED